jgi:hypothetical protein
MIYHYAKTLSKIVNVMFTYASPLLSIALIQILEVALNSARREALIVHAGNQARSIVLISKFAGKMLLTHQVVKPFSHALVGQQNVSAELRSTNTRFVFTPTFAITQKLLFQFVFNHVKMVKKNVIVDKINRLALEILIALIQIL